MSDSANPTAAIRLDFADYVAKREQSFADRTHDGVPTYAFGMDVDLRRKIASVRALRNAATVAGALTAAVTRDKLLLSGVAVSPTQYPHIFQIGEECARRLNIGLPQIFIVHTAVINAFAIATDDIEPIIILSSALVESFDVDELRFVIGHEAGHIHNNHGIYHLAIEMLSNPLLRLVTHQIIDPRAIAGAGGYQFTLLYQVLQRAMSVFLMAWIRSREITSDRAGLICCGDVRAAQQALARTELGHVTQQGFNLDEYVQQLDKASASSRLLGELFRSHPLTPRRIMALQHFAESETYLHWRPDAAVPNSPCSHEELERACAALVNPLAKVGTPTPGTS